MFTLLLARAPSTSLACLPLLALAALSGCGGGSDDPQPDVALLEGDWQHQRCNAVEGQGERSFMRLKREDGTHFTLQSGALRYANGDCSGNATVQLSAAGQPVQFVARRNASTAALTIFWANWAYEPATNQPSSLWVRQGDFLCQSFYAPSPRPPAATTLPQPAVASTSASGPNDEYNVERIVQQTDTSLQGRFCHARTPG